MTFKNLPAVVAFAVFATLVPSGDGVLAGETGAGKPPDNRALDTFELSYTHEVLGPASWFSVTRQGKVRYTYTTPTGMFNSGPLVQVDKRWQLPEREAVALLRGLVADGLLDVEDPAGARGSMHFFQVTAGDWQRSAYPRSMPAAVMKRLQPYLEKAHPELWKKAP
jgi:hypothetical protein